MEKDVQSIKERWKKLAEKTRKKLVVFVGGTILIALGIAAFLYLSRDTSYSVLFAGLNQEEAQEVISLLQEQGITYRHNTSNGNISVPAAVEGETKAKLLNQGYPKSGFSYDIFIDNAGLMSTESDKERYSLYDLQDRLGAQIRLFDGVQDAKVTIVEAAESRYALSDETQKEASASVTVTMESGRTLQTDNADAIRRLVETSVRGMDFTKVAVFDARTGLEVGGGNGSDSAYGAASDATELATLVEQKVAANIRPLLEKIYGQGNVVVAVKGTLNMENLIRESMTYSTPEKIDEEDKTGLLQRETVNNEGENGTDPGAGDVAGADANADTPRYTNETGDGTGADSYYNNSATREWLYNYVKEQSQINPGFLEDTTVSVVIDTDDLSVPEVDIRNLIANAAGIPTDQMDEKIALVRTLSPETKALRDAQQTVQPQPDDTAGGLPLPILIAIGALIVLILLIVFLLILRRRRKKRGDDAQIAAAISPGELGASQGNWTEEEFPGGGARPTVQFEEDDEMSQNEEILKLKMQRNMKLKQSIGEIVDQNPQIVAKLVQSWMNEEGDGNGGSSGDKKRRAR